MEQKITQVHHIAQEALTEIIINGVEKKLNQLKKEFQPIEPTKWITRKEVCEILGVSLVTLSAWTKQGILISYKISNQIRYKREEIDLSIKKVL